MRIAIFADIHANIEALEAVLDDMQTERVEKLVCLGDVVGYNANPSECLERIREIGCPVVQGNHDFYCGNDDDLSLMNQVAQQALQWTRDHLSEEQRTWLRELPLTHEVDGLFETVHASLDRPEAWTYVLRPEDARASMKHQTKSVCFCGHTHYPLVFEQNMLSNTMRNGAYNRFKIRPGHNYMVNCGSVGQPRDGNPQAAYAIFDLADQTISLRRVKYDVAASVKKIREAELPERLAQRLLLGK